MLIMGAHEIRTLGAAVIASVDATYTAGDLCDGDPSTPIRVAGGSVSAALTFTSGSINGLVVANTNLDAAASVAFSGLGTVTMPPVPAGNIRLNGVEFLSSPATASSTTVATTAGGPAIIGEVLAGLFREIRTLPPRPDHAHRAFQIVQDGEYTGLSYSKGAVSRSFGGSVYLDDASYQIVQDAFDASEQNSKPTVIVPLCDANDAWLVTWTTYNPRPIQPDLWLVDVQWQELPRYRWPA